MKARPRYLVDEKINFPGLSMRLSVILPARNEAHHIHANLRRVCEALAGAELEVVVVDDGSTDATSAEARLAAAEGPAGQGGPPGAEPRQGRGPLQRASPSAAASSWRSSTRTSRSRPRTCAGSRSC